MYLVWQKNIIDNWSELFQQRKSFYFFVFNFLMSLSIYMILVELLKLNSESNGVVIRDPIQHFFVPRDFSTPIFLITYSCVFSFVLYIIQYPRILHKGFHSFTFVFILRFLAIILMPLKPPADMILLVDRFVWGMTGGCVITNDLFFSGHVSDICIFIFLTAYKPLKYMLIVAVIVVAFLLVWQKVHYSMDVLCAPIFAFFAHYLFVEKQYVRCLRLEEWA